MLANIGTPSREANRDLVGNTESGEVVMAPSSTAHGSLRKSRNSRHRRCTVGNAYLCLYETREDLLDTCLAYFADNEFAVWAVLPGHEGAGAGLVASRHPGVRPHLAAGQIGIVRGTNGISEVVRLKRIISGWSEKLSSAVAKGFAGMRVSGNAFWLQHCIAATPASAAAPRLQPAADPNPHPARQLDLDRPARTPPPPCFTGRCGRRPGHGKM